VSETQVFIMGVCDICVHCVRDRHVFPCVLCVLVFVFAAMAECAVVWGVCFSVCSFGAACCGVLRCVAVSCSSTLFPPLRARGCESMNFHISGYGARNKIHRRNYACFETQD